MVSVADSSSLAMRSLYPDSTCLITTQHTTAMLQAHAPLEVWTSSRKWHKSLPIDFQSTVISNGRANLFTHLGRTIYIFILLTLSLNAMPGLSTVWKPKSQTHTPEYAAHIADGPYHVVPSSHSVRHSVFKTYSFVSLLNLYNNYLYIQTILGRCYR